MKKITMILTAFAFQASLFAQKPAPTAAPAKAAVTTPAPAAPVAAAEPQPRSQTPVMDATAFGMGVGAYGQYSTLGGHLQLGILDWLRLSGAITGALPGDQAGSFSFSNYSFLWQFSGAMVFTASKIYKNIARPYTALELTYYLDAKAKAGGLNGAFKIGLDLYMTQDYSIYVEAGVMMNFMRDIQAPAISGALVGLGARTFF